jgi:hypothetical protein
MLQTLIQVTLEREFTQFLRAAPFERVQRGTGCGMDIVMRRRSW